MTHGAWHGVLAAGHGFLGGPQHQHHPGGPFHVGGLGVSPLPPLLGLGSPSLHGSLAMDAPPVVQTGAAGLSAVLWRSSDGATSDRLAHQEGAHGLLPWVSCATLDVQLRCEVGGLEMLHYF
jgi:hypothetical protein